MSNYGLIYIFVKFTNAYSLHVDSRDGDALYPIVHHGECQTLDQFGAPHMHLDWNCILIRSSI